MNPIRRLDAKVIDQIAAGEVVERPASVIKELVENALDSGAGRIEIRLREGGRKRIEVRDDGAGIPEAELPLAVTSHATSKLCQTSDLDAVATLGFRGEALASIGAVSRMEITSRPRDSEAAASLRVIYGRLEGPRAASGPAGTRVLVEDLFADLPARLKFLKRSSTELAHCSAWVERLALAHRGSGFLLEHEDRRLLEIAAGDDLAARCNAVFGSGFSAHGISIQERGDLLSLDARIGPPEMARRNASRVHLFVNGRWVRDARLLAAVREGVKEFLPVGHYPTLFLELAVPPGRVDVNVHPQKTEVRFRDQSFVFASILRALQRGLAGSSWATRRVGEVGRSAEDAGAGFLPGRFPSPSRVWERPAGTGSAPDSPTTADALPSREPPLARAGRGEPFAVGAVLSVANTFLVREVPGGLEIFDQHALHERVNLEELRREIRAGQVVSQPLLVPALVEVSRAEAELLLGNGEVFRSLGVDLEAFGETTVAVRAVPARLTRLQPEALVRDLLQLAASPASATPDRLQEETLHTMACRAAVRAGDRLDGEALRDLLRRGAVLPQDRTCAHGRPVRVFLSLADLERAFDRR